MKVRGTHPLRQEGRGGGLQEDAARNVCHECGLDLPPPPTHTYTLGC